MCLLSCQQDMYLPMDHLMDLPVDHAMVNLMEPLMDLLMDHLTDKTIHLTSLGINPHTSLLIMAL